MENKSNQSTPQRPEGDRTLLANLVEVDLNKFIIQIRSEKAWTDGSHNAITVFKSDVIRIVLMGLHEKAELKAHTANGPISVQVLEGNIEFMTEGKTYPLEKNQLIHLAAKIPHSVKAVKESFFLLTVILNNS